MFHISVNEIITFIKFSILIQLVPHRKYDICESSTQQPDGLTWQISYLTASATVYLVFHLDSVTLGGLTVYV